MLCFSRVYSRVISLTLTRAFASFDQFNLITNSDFALLQHGKIEARTLTRQEPLDHVGPAEPDAELVTGHPRLGHHHDGRANAKLVPDV